jgi:RNA polymerase sigma-70 factor (ECF subfamily)
MPEGELAQEILLFGNARTVDRAALRPEIELIERVRAGDEEAFGELYRMFAPMINGVVLARVAREDVQDIVQDVFLAAYRNLNSLRDDNFFGAWLVKIARNRAAEWYRTRKPAEGLDESLTAAENRRGEAAEVLRAIRSLSEAYSETLVMRLVEGMSAKEIAERTGLKPESVRVNLHRGMELLRTKLGIEGERK